jgi:hypothetical protein
MINVKGTARRSHSNWLRTANRNRRSTLARILVTVSPVNPNVLMKDRRTGLRSPNPRPNPLLVTIASTHTNPKATNRSPKSNAECKRPPHKLTNPQPWLSGTPQTSSPSLKISATQSQTARRFRGPRKWSPPTPLKRARATENLLIVWCGDSTKEILETNKQTAGNLRLPLHDPLNQQTKTTLLVDSHKQPVL